MKPTAFPQTGPTRHSRKSWLAWRGDGQRFLVAVFTAFLFMRSTAGSFWTAKNRFFHYWHTPDMAGVFGAILLMGLMFWVAWRILDQWGPAGRWMGDAAFAVILLQYARVNIAESLISAGMLASWGVWTLHATHLALLALFLFMRRRIVGALRNGCLLLSPILLVYAWTLLNALSYEQVTQNRHARNIWPPQPLSADTPAAGNGVFLLVFDEWAYRRVFDETGTVKPGYPGLKKATSNAIVFTSAYAPGTLTMESVPQILTGRHGDAYIADTGVLWLDTTTKQQPFAAYDTLFTDFRRRGYRTAMIGCYLPYADLLGADADISVSYDLYRLLGESPFALALNLIVENFRIRLGFVHDAITWPFYMAQHHYHARMAESIHVRTIDLMRAPESWFVMMHQLPPHMPFIFDREGPRNNLHRRATTSLEDYYLNLQYADRLIHELVDTADSLIDNVRPLLVITSDHGFRYDPVLQEMSPADEVTTRRHVPLIVIPPYDQGKKTIETPFDLTDLRNVLTTWADKGRFPDNWQSSHDAPAREDGLDEFLLKKGLFPPNAE